MCGPEMGSVFRSRSMEYGPSVWAEDREQTDCALGVWARSKVQTVDMVCELELGNGQWTMCVNTGGGECSVDRVHGPSQGP